MRKATDTEEHRYACEVRTVATYKPKLRAEYFALVAKHRGEEYSKRLRKDVLEALFERDLPGQA